jgi:diguanylate cyclase (GGDEF)-like protein
MLHSLLSVYAVGWECGFAMYLIAIIPIGFDLAFALNDKAKGISIAVAFGVLSFAVFILCKRFSYICSPVYTIESDFFRELIYIFNTLCTFALLISYSFVFASEILHAQKSLEENNRKLDALASTDTLTGLYNRRRMHVFLKAAAEEKRTFSVIMSDIDDFKHINDTYGHDCGDEALKTVSAIVKECLPQDDNVCRWGGEEFLMISSRTLSEAADIAEKIRAAVESRQISYEGKDIRITLTLGVAEYTPGISTIDSVITAADKKLYEGKNSGKNCVIS